MGAVEGFVDASGFSSFVFWVKGLSGGELFQVGLKDTSGTEVTIESKALVLVSSSEWRQVLIGLDDFAGVNTAAIENVSFGFNRNHGEGAICLDDMAFLP